MRLSNTDIANKLKKIQGCTNWEELQFLWALTLLDDGGIEWTFKRNKFNLIIGYHMLSMLNVIPSLTY